MKMILRYIFLCLMFLTGFSSYTQSPTALYEGPIEDVKLVAARAKRPILIDFSSETCTQCAKMYKQLYFDAEVSKKLNEQFLVYKVSHVEPEGKKLMQEYNVKEFPVFLLVNENGKVLKKILGYHTNKQFLEKMKPFFKEETQATLEVKSKKEKNKVNQATKTTEEPPKEATNKKPKKKKALFF